jgi:hypothetical protein
MPAKAVRFFMTKFYWHGFTGYGDKLFRIVTAV